MTSEELEGGAEAGAAVLPQPPETETGPPGPGALNVVDEAELLLRASAPHDFDVLVIGSGPGGHAAAIHAARMGAHVGMVEAGELGGASLNRTCLPARMLRELARTGATPGRPELEALQARRSETAARLRDENQRELIRHNVEVLTGRARFAGKHTVEVSSETGRRRVKAVYIVIATGSHLRPLNLPGAGLSGVMSAEALLTLENLPVDTVTIGSGGVALETACLLRSLGARSTLLSEAPAIAGPDDEETISAVLQWQQRAGLRIETGAALRAIESADGRLMVRFTNRGSRARGESTVPADAVVLAGERVCDAAGLGLDRAGIVHSDGRIAVDDDRQTSVAGVYAVGECVHGECSAQLAAAEGMVAASHLMRQPRTIDPGQIALCWRAHPEVACIGLTEAQALREGMNVASGRAHYRQCHQAAAVGLEEGWLKLVADLDSRRLAGCQIIGEGAGELINLVAALMRTGTTAGEVAGMVFAHPSLAELLPVAARAIPGTR